MSLFQFGFTISTPETSSRRQESSVPSHLPRQDETGLNNEEYENVSAAVTDIADPTPTQASGKQKRKSRGTYTVYTEEQRASIGRYASMHGNEKARKKFLSDLPNLTESSIRNFKKMYLKKLREEKMRNPATPKPVAKLSVQPKGRFPLMLDLDSKLIKFLQGVRAKGGVVNIHVVRATAKALIQSNPSQMQHFVKFDMPRSWVQSIYRRMGVSRRLGTTGRPPVPKGIYSKYFLGILTKKLKLLLSHIA